MELLMEIIQFLIYSLIIVLVSKYLLVPILRKIGEILKLKAKTIGNIAGIATSIPELLTVSFSAFTGLIATSTYNIISSNIINLIQYTMSVLLNKNQKILQNKAIKIDLLLVALTIVIPILMLVFNIENNLFIVPILIILFVVFYKITNNAHKLYISQSKRDKTIIEPVEKESINIIVENSIWKKRRSVLIQFILLIIVGIILYCIGNLLSDVLNSLCRTFEIPELILGTLLGLITSIPELITFFESQKHHKKTNQEDGVIEATGNLLTSNKMNLFIIQSIGIIIYFFCV